MTAPRAAVLWRDFHGLHRSGWKRDEPGALSLVADAFAHPAKVRPDLAQKIVSHALAMLAAKYGCTKMAQTSTSLTWTSARLVATASNW